LVPANRDTVTDNFNINLHEKSVYSQNGEDGILEFIFSKIGTTNKFSVEFGVGNGSECNTVYLLQDKGWQGLMMNYGAINTAQPNAITRWKRSIRKFKLFCRIIRSVNFLTQNSNRPPPRLRHPLDIKTEKVTAENIQQLLKKYNTPQNFDLLSIDIDFNDYWVWKSISDYSPRVVVIEFNSSIPPTESKVVRYDQNTHWDGTNYFGASLLALKNLGLEKGYTLVGCDSNGVNAFFCRSELVSEIKIKGIEELYRPPRYGKIVGGVHIGHPPSKKTMIEI